LFFWGTFCTLDCAGVCKKKKDEKWDVLTHKKERGKLGIQETEITAFNIKLEKSFANEKLNRT